MVERALGGAFAAVLRVDGRRVEAERYHLDTLQAEHAKRLRPAPVVADAHAEHAAQHAPHQKAEVAGLEVALFEVLMAPLGIELVMTGQVDLAVLADDLPRFVHQDRRVEVIPVRREFGIAEAHGYGGALRLLEQRPGGGIRHFALEPDVGIAAVFAVPAREKRGQRKLWIDDEVAALGLPHEVDHAGDHGLARIGLLDRAELGGGDFDVAHCHQGFAGSTWVLRSSGAASGEIMNWIMAREASGSLDTFSNATLDGQGSLREPGSGPTYSVLGAPTMM